MATEETLILTSIIIGGSNLPVGPEIAHLTPKFHPVCPLELQLMTNISLEYSMCCPKKLLYQSVLLEDLMSFLWRK